MEKCHHNEKEKKKLNIHRIAVMSQRLSFLQGMKLVWLGHRIMALKVLCKYFN